MAYMSGRTRACKCRVLQTLLSHHIFSVFLSYILIEHVHLAKPTADTFLRHLCFHSSNVCNERTWAECRPSRKYPEVLAFANAFYRQRSWKCMTHDECLRSRRPTAVMKDDSSQGNQTHTSRSHYSSLKKSEVTRCLVCLVTGHDLSCLSTQ